MQVVFFADVQNWNDTLIMNMYVVYLVLCSNIFGGIFNLEKSTACTCFLV